MDVRSFKLHLPDRHARVILTDATGDHPHDLDADRFDLLLPAAAPLLAAAARLAGAPLRALSIDTVAQVARISLTANPSNRPAAVLRGPDYLALTATLGDLSRALLTAIHPRRPPPSGSPSDPDFWSDIYRANRDGWEIARATPPLARLLTANPPSGQRVLVVGCGRGHEARLAARLGAHVVAVDFAPEAIADARALAAAEHLTIDFRVRDLFTLPSDPDRYDLVLEHCCFCAIDPSRRSEYAHTISSLLVPHGTLLALFWAHGRPNGPPFTTSRSEIETLFPPYFTIQSLETPPDSVAARSSQELLATFQKR